MLLTSLKQLLRPEMLRKLQWLTVAATLITVSIIILPYVATPSPAVQSKMLALRVLLAFLIVLGLLNLPQFLRHGWHFGDTIFAGLLGSYVVSAAFSGRLLYCLSESWHYAGFVILGWLVIRLRPTFGETSAILRLAGMLGLLSGLYGFLTYINMDILKPLYPFDFEEDSGGRNFIHSFFGNPEYFGGFAAPTAVILLGLGFQPGIGLLRRVAWIMATGFVLAVLAFSGSRGAFIGFIAGGLIVFLGQVSLLSHRVQKLCWITTALSLAALIGGLTILSTPNPLNARDLRLLQRFKDIGNTQSDSIRERLLFYTSTAMAIPTNPILGFGPGTYRLEFFNNVKLLEEKDDRAGTVVLLQELNRRLAEHTHNDYLEFWFEQGIVGFGLLLLLIAYATTRFTMLRWNVRQAAVSRDQLYKPTAAMVTIMAATVAIFVNAMTSFPLHMPARGTLAWVLIGLFFGIAHVVEGELEAIEEPEAQQG